MTQASIDDLLPSAGSQFADVGNGITLCYETFGDAAAPALLLIGGLGDQLIGWPTGLCAQLVAAGFHVLRFDNRDAGLSTFMSQQVDVAEIGLAVLNGEQPEYPYLLSDMAEDAVGLLDHLGVERPHVVGISMGGMIAQTMAIEHGHRVASLTSIMSTTGDIDVGIPTAEALEAMAEPPSTTREQAIEAAVTHSKIWGGVFVDAADVRAAAAARWDRQPADGSPRQLAAIIASGSRSERLRALSVPTLVIHGTDDTLLPPAGGERTAELISGATLMLIEGMGHDLSRPLWPQFVDAIGRHAKRSV